MRRAEGSEFVAPLPLEDAENEMSTEKKSMRLGGEWRIRRTNEGKSTETMD